MMWEDPTFNNFSIGARLLFVGMFSNADDEGFIRGDAGSLKRLIFGFDDNIKPELDGWLNEIRVAKNIHFYETEGETYAHFLKWDKHQKQQKDRIQLTQYPMCSICVASDKQVPTKVKLSKGKVSKDNTTIATPPSVASEIVEVINLFQSLNPSYKKFFGNNTQRGAAERMLKIHGLEKLKKLIEILPQTNGKQYMPIITTPLQLEDKMGMLMFNLKKTESKGIQSL